MAENSNILNFQIELNRIREDFNRKFGRIQDDFDQKFERTMANSVAERNRIQDKIMHEISEIPKMARYQMFGIGVGGVEAVCGICSGSAVVYSNTYGLYQNMPINAALYALPLLLLADALSRWFGVAAENKELAYWGIALPVVKGLKKLESYLMRE